MVSVRSSLALALLVAIASAATIQLNWNMHVGTNNDACITVGDTVQWYNDNRQGSPIPHQIVWVNNAFPASPQFYQTQTHDQTFNVAGTFDYHDGVFPAHLMAGTITVTGECSITDTSVVGPYTSSPEECSSIDATGCTWYLETRYADCTEFCQDNGLSCVSAQVLGTGTTFAGCSGVASHASAINCTGTGTNKARYSRTCTCAPSTSCP